MRDFFYGLLIILVIVVMMLGVVWVVQGNDFFVYKAFAPKMEQVRRETFEQSKAYNQGMIQELDQMYLDYQKTKDQGEKDAIKSIYLHRVADYDENKMPGYLRDFTDQLRNNQTQSGGNWK